MTVTAKAYIVTNVAGDTPDIGGSTRAVGSRIYLTDAQAEFELSRNTVVPTDSAGNPIGNVDVVPVPIMLLNGKTGPSVTLTAGDVGAYDKAEVDAKVAALGNPLLDAMIFG